MDNKSSGKAAKFVLAGVFAAALAYAGWLQFKSPSLFEVDSYYHIAVTGFMKDHGPLREFRWTQMSVMKNAYSDKDFLLHALALPFTYAQHDPVKSAKWAALFFNALFFAGFLFLLRRYLPAYLTALLFAIPFFCPTYMMYFLYFRPAILANIFTLFAVYFLITKNRWGIIISAALYALAHLSAFTVLYFAALCEAVRYLKEREFRAANIGYAALGLATGLVIHPNFPANLLTIYINGLLAPIYAFTGKNINFAQELYSGPTKDIFIDNFPVFFIFAGLFWHLAIAGRKLSHSTLVLLLSAQTYAVLSMLSNRFWYPAIPLAVLALASYLKDVLDDGEPRKFRQLAFVSALWAALAALTLPHSVANLLQRIERKTAFNRPYETAALWLRDNIPPGETIFHSSWADSPYFICFNPKNNYLVTLDPIYMYYWSPEAERAYEDLYMGAPADAYKYLRTIFKTRYGFTAKQTGFYALIRNDPRFEHLTETESFLIFKLKDLPPSKTDAPGK